MRWNAHNLQIVSSAKDIDRLEEEVKDRWQHRSVFTKLLIAIVSFVVSYTHVLCYITACIAHAYCGGLITLPLPLMVFLWATLSSPRPPKLFWIIMITYTELIIIVQFVFQFGFWTKDANADAEDSAFKLSHVIGVQKRENFAVWNVALLVCLFLHRYMLRRIGIWNDENIENESSRGNMQSLASFGTLSIETDVDDVSF